jgi:GntR family transcriptional regulator
MESFDFRSAVPCLLIKRHSYLRGGIMVEYVEGVFRGDTYIYRQRLEM